MFYSLKHLIIYLFIIHSFTHMRLKNENRPHVVRIFKYILVINCLEKDNNESKECITSGKVIDDCSEEIITSFNKSSL